MKSDIKKATSAVARKAAGKVINTFKNVNPIVVLSEITHEYIEYKKILQQERTKREHIETWKEINLKAIEAKQDIFIKYLELSFDERKNNFKRLFKILDTAVKKEDIQTIANTLDAIVKLAQENPFKQLASEEYVRGVLEDPTKKFDL